MEEQKNYIDIRWYVDDVHACCERRSLPKLTDKQAMDILNDVKKHHDACGGVNWDTIAVSVELYCEEHNIN